MRNCKLEIHCQPDAVVTSPDYAKRLVEEAGVDGFILRTGYGLDYPKTISQAIQLLRDLSVKVSFLIGSWWGGEIREVENLPSKSWESKYPMDMPGSSKDEAIIDKYKTLCSRYHPDSVVLTHTRYRHPAYLDGIFCEGDGDPAYLSRMSSSGISRTEILSARASWESAIGKADINTLLSASENGLVSFLCELSQSDAVARLMDFRCRSVNDSMTRFRQVINDCGVPFGSNIYSPIASIICGQTYDAYTAMCDFVQPLLPFMEYQRYEPLAAWARYLMTHSKMDEMNAILIARRLFYLGDTICPQSIKELDTCLEGDGKMVYAIMKKELSMCAPYLSGQAMIQPVFRGKGWDWNVTDELMDEARTLGINSFAFMGCEYLLRDTTPPDTGYKYSLTDPSPGDGWF